MEKVTAFLRHSPGSGLRNLRSLEIFFFLVSVGEGMVAPAIPLRGDELGASYSFIGFFMTGFSVAYVASTLFAGRMSDRFSRKKILLASLVIAFAASVGYNFSTTAGMLLFFRTLEGLGRGILFPVAEAVIADNTSMHGRGVATSRFTAAYALGVALGNLCGGALMQHVNLSAAFPLYPLLALLAVVTVMKGISDTGHINSEFKSGEKTFNGDIRGEIKKIWPICYVCFAYGGFLYSLWALLSMVAAHFNVSLMGIGIIFAIFWCCRLVSILVAGPKSEQIGIKKVLLAGVIMAAISTAALMIAQQFWVFIVAAVLGGLGTGVIFPLSIALVADLAAPDYRGFDMGFMELSIGLGMIIQTFMSGLLGELGGVQLTYSFSFLALVIAIIFTLFFIKEAPGGTAG